MDLTIFFIAAEGAEGSDMLFQKIYVFFSTVDDLDGIYTSGPDFSCGQTDEQTDRLIKAFLTTSHTIQFDRHYSLICFQISARQRQTECRAR